MKVLEHACHLLQVPQPPLTANLRDHKLRETLVRDKQDQTKQASVKMDLQLIKEKLIQ